MNQTVNPDAVAYLDAVRGRLRGLPSDQVEEFLADLELHLAELIADEPGPLRERLGSPDDYAAELVASGGWPTSDGRTVRSMASVLSDSLRSLAGSGPVSWWRQHWPDYRPGWWIARGALAGFVFTVIQTVDRAAPWLWAVPLVFGSVWIGRRASRHTGWRAADLLLTVVGLYAVVVGLANDVRAMPHSVVFTYLNDNPYGIVGPGGQIINFYAFNPDGSPVQVFLYDQNGNPVETLMSGDPPMDDYRLRAEDLGIHSRPTSMVCRWRTSTRTKSLSTGHHGQYPTCWSLKSPTDDPTIRSRDDPLL